MDREQSNFVPSRRRLGALLAAGAAVALPSLPAVAGAAGADPHPAWFREGDEITAKVNGGNYRDEAEAEALMDRIGELDRLAIATPPTTTAGVVACLEWVRREYLEFKILDQEPDGGDRLVMGLLEHAVKVLRGSQLA